MFEFNVGDVVRIGSNGEKGKIVDIVFPAGAQACVMYKVQLFMDGSIRTVDKISLVKGLPNELSVEQNKAAETHTAPPVPTLLYSDIFEMDNTNFDQESVIETAPPVPTLLYSDIFEMDNTYFDEDSVIETAPDDQITELLASVGATADYPLPDNLFDNGVDPFVAEVYDKTTTPSFQDPSVKLEPQSRFTKPVEIEQFIYENENKNTRRKTLSHQKLFECYLAEQSEDRAICEIPPTELNVYIGQFLLCVRKVDGTEYEPVTLRSILGSIERYLRRHNYGYSVISGHEFSNAREALKCKQKDLKRQGKGNKPQAADAVTEEHIDKLYESDQLGTKTPSSLINTLWFNNTLHFGMRAGGAEHRQLCWGDLQLCYDHDLQKEYIEFNERQTKTRTGEDISNTRKEKPRMYAELGHPRCPVATYKKYADKRPEKMCTNDSPFYLATITHKINPGEDERWFLSQPIGVNKLTSLLKTMATKSNLPDLPYMRITNTSVRKHLCQKLLDNNVPDTQAIHITGHKNPHSLNNYRNMSNRQQQEVSSLLSTTSAEKHESVSEPQVASNSSVQATLANDDSAFNHQVVTEPPMPVRNQNIPQNIHLSNSEETASFHVDSNNVLRSIFQNAQIHGGVFNITVNLQPPAKRPRIENES